LYSFYSTILNREKPMRMTRNLLNALNFRSLIKLTITSLFIGMAFSSCKEKDPIALTIPARVSFTSNTFLIDKDFTGTLPVTINLARPLETAGTITISIDNTTTAATTEYATSPAATSNAITLNLDKGASSASFTVTSAHNFNDIKTVTFKITATTGGAVLGDSNLSTTVTMRGNNWVTPAITTSVTTLGNFGNVSKGALSTAKSYTLSGVNLSGGVSIAASDNFKLSLDNVNFSSSLSTTLGSTAITIYVKFAPATGVNQAIAGTITNSSSGVNSIAITVAGTETGNIPYVPEVPLLNENFDYGATSNFLTRVSADWVAYSSPGAIPVTYIAQGLSFPRYAGSNIGGSVTLEHGDFSREDIARTYTPQTSGTVYLAVMINVSAAGTGDFFLSLRDNAGGFFNRLYAKDDGNGNLILGVGKNSTAQYPLAGTFKYNTTYLAVVKYDFTAKTSSLYILDSSIPDAEPGTPTAASPTGTAPTTLNDVAIRQADGILSANIDGIRIATTWRGVLGI
jgi:hypothetical protein